MKVLLKSFPSFPLHQLLQLHHDGCESALETDCGFRHMGLLTKSKYYLGLGKIHNQWPFDEGFLACLNGGYGGWCVAVYTHDADDQLDVGIVGKIWIELVT